MSQLKTYTVAMIMWETWNICVDAASEDEAKAQAHASYEQHGREDSVTRPAASTASRSSTKRRSSHDRHPPSPAA